MTHEEKKDWQFFREKAQNMLWPHVEAEYRAELQGIADGAVARGVKLDLWDVVALNAWLEMPYFDKVYDKQHGLPATTASAAEHCSAFVATGSYTKDGRVVIAHNNWTSYETGERWNIIFDIVPAQGNHFLMDGMPGLIHSGDDFGVNSAGIMITETTISRFNGFDPDAVPEFVRARKAMQYSASIDDFARIMKDGNNGGYANDWLVADRKTNEIASLELGLKNVTLDRSARRLLRGLQLPDQRKAGARRDRIRLEESRAKVPMRATCAGSSSWSRTRARSTYRPRSAFWPTISILSKTRWIPTSARSAATSTCRRAATCRGSGPMRRRARCSRKLSTPPWAKP